MWKCFHIKLQTFIWLKFTFCWKKEGSDCLAGFWDIDVYFFNEGDYFGCDDDLDDDGNDDDVDNDVDDDDVEMCLSASDSG